MTVYHIRRKLRRLGGSQYYKDKSPRKAETHCGSPVTDKDIPWNGKAESWEDNTPCPACIEARHNQHGA